MRAASLAVPFLFVVTAMQAQEKKDPPKADPYPLRVTLKWTDPQRMKEFSFEGLPAKWAKAADVKNTLLVVKITSTIRTEKPTAGATLTEENTAEKTVWIADKLYFSSSAPELVIQRYRKKGSE